MRRYLILAFLLFSQDTRGQSPCPALQAPVVPPGANLFTGQQETELGEIIRQQVERDFLVIDEEALTGYVKGVGGQIIGQLPDTGLKYEFSLYDQPEIQAFGMPGGHIYISRKMVAFLRNKDELAGLIGHELGHLVARQQAVEMSRAFREVLSVKSLSADEDLFDRYNDFIDRLRMKKQHGSGNAEKGQQIADQLGIQAVARAGYAPQAFPDFMDRLMETKGATGSWLSDLFGTTRQDSRRLREALRDVSNLPKTCIEKSEPSGEESFHKWQDAVLRYHGIGHAERLPKVLARVRLNDPLRGDIQTFRFSSDGKYLLAQDEGGIYVSTRDPLQFVFRIEAPDAGAAQFSPDARHIVFFNRSLRVETWDVERQEQTSLADVPALHGCRNTALSADARYLACLGNNMTLSLYDVSTGETVLQVEKFFAVDGETFYHHSLLAILTFLTHGSLTTLRFSPDGHYFAASSRTDQEVVFDLIARKKINISGTLRTAISYAFTFVGQDRIVGVDRFRQGKSPLLEFPSGKVIEYIPLGGDTLLSATNPRYLLIGPLKERPLGAFDLVQKNMVFANRTEAVDIWGEMVASERLNGEIGVYKVGEGKPITVLTLPLGKLGTLRSFAVSPDLRWMAMSGGSRGGEWDIEKNARVLLTRSFRNAAFAPNSKLLVDFPQFEKNNRQVVVLIAGMKDPLRDVSVGEKDAVEFTGNEYVKLKSHEDKPSLRNVVLEARDATSDQQLWSRNFPKQGPGVFVSAAGERLIFLWSGKSDGVREEMASSSKLVERWKNVSLGEGDVFAEILNARDGVALGGVVIHTGKYSFTPEHADAVGDTLALTDNRNRVLVYSLITGDVRARLFGSRPKVSGDGERLCLANGRGQLALFDLRSLKRTAEFSFSAPVSSYEFSGDGKRLLVLTNDQTVFVLDANTAQARDKAAADPKYPAPISAERSGSN
jgi:WD40 repeat protein